MQISTALLRATYVEPPATLYIIPKPASRGYHSVDTGSTKPQGFHVSYHAIYLLPSILKMKALLVQDACGS